MIACKILCSETGKIMILKFKPTTKSLLQSAFENFLFPFRGKGNRNSDIYCNFSVLANYKITCNSAVDREVFLAPDSIFIIS